MFFGFWLLYLSRLLYSLLCPFRSERLMKSVRYRRSVHIAEILIVLVCSFLPSIIMICILGYRYSGFRPVCNTRSVILHFCISIVYWSYYWFMYAVILFENSKSSQSKLCSIFLYL